MYTLQYAVDIEQQAASIIDLLSDGVPQHAVSISVVLKKHQSDAVSILSTAVREGTVSLSKAEVQISIDDQAWQSSINDASSSPESLVKWQYALWAIQELYERLFQFYIQASRNAYSTDEKLFFSSMAEVKNVIRRRLDTVSRIISNEIWGKLGFAPFALGKE